MTYLEALMTGDNEGIARELCRDIEKAVSRINNETESEIGACDVCPFNNLCSKGNYGFLEWLKQEWD